MNRKDFYKMCKEELGLKNLEEARERTDLFWKSVFTALEEDEKARAVFKDWGVFYVKDVKPRRTKVPTIDEIFYTKPKKTIKFYCGKGLRARVNGND